MKTKNNFSCQIHSRKINLPNGMSQSKHDAARHPADAPLILSSNKCGAYFLKQTATPT